MLGCSNSVIPFEQIATIRMDKAPPRISHSDSKRAITVTANVEGANKGKLISAAMNLTKAIDFPPGYGI
jgi:multidrug efflux pump subunit AcrB